MAQIIREYIKFVDPKHPHVKYLVFKCFACGNEFDKQASYYRKQIKRRKNACSFCSRSCVAKNTFSGMTGNKNPKWKGGRYTDKKGYVWVFKPSHPLAMNNRYVFEHRLVMEKFLGRFLYPEEHIHHINDNTSDNRIENLDLVSKSAHSYLHAIKRNYHPTFKGKKHSAETKQKMRFAKLGKKRGHYHPFLKSK
jgi:hypothetical protein